MRLSDSDKRMRNKVEVVALTMYSIGLVLFAITKCPLCILTTALTYPICLSKKGKKFITT